MNIPHFFKFWRVDVVFDSYLHIKKVGASPNIPHFLRYPSLAQVAFFAATFWNGVLSNRIRLQHGMSPNTMRRSRVVFGLIRGNGNECYFAQMTCRMANCSRVVFVSNTTNKISDFVYSIILGAINNIML